MVVDDLVRLGHEAVIFLFHLRCELCHVGVPVVAVGGVADDAGLRDTASLGCGEVSALTDRWNAGEVIWLWRPWRRDLHECPELGDCGAAGWKRVASNGLQGCGAFVLGPVRS